MLLVFIYLFYSHLVLNKKQHIQYTLCLLLRLKFRSTRGASHHPAFMGTCQTISHTPHSSTYPVDEGSNVRIQFIALAQCRDLGFGRLKLGIKMCNIALIASAKIFLWVTARLLVTRPPIALSDQWMKETRCEFSPLPGVSARIWNIKD